MAAEINENSVVKLRIVGFGLFIAQLVYITFFMTSAYLEISHKIDECHKAHESLSNVFNQLSQEMAVKREAIFFIAELKRRLEKVEAKCEK